MVDLKFNHHNRVFGIVVADWGSPDSAQVAAMNLKHWVEALDRSETEALHSRLRESDEAYGDDPVWETTEMTALRDAQSSAQTVGLAAAESDLNQGHACNCQLLPLPFPR